jgi:hypothetical protein
MRCAASSRGHATCEEVAQCHIDISSPPLRKVPGSGVGRSIGYPDMILMVLLDLQTSFATTLLESCFLSMSLKVRVHNHSMSVNILS